MVCPFCFSQKTSVYNSRPTKRLNGLWRRRHCEACDKQFTTRETVDASSILKIEGGAPFSQTKLLVSIAHACDHRTDDAAYWLTETITQQLLQQCANQQITLQRADIRNACLITLKRFDTRAFMKYLSSHSDDTFDSRALKKELR